VIYQKRAFANFLAFVFLSGLGWICDFLTFLLLVKVVGVSSFVGNFISSYVGVTFVWFVSLKMVFNRRTDGQAIFLFAYWCFQFFSILGYSQSLRVVDLALLNTYSSSLVGQNPEIAAKIIITPFNLLTNFIFMKFLTRFMRGESTTRA